MIQIHLKNSNNNCFTYVIFESLFSDFDILCNNFKITLENTQKSSVINNLINISLQLKNKNPDINSLKISSDYLRKIIEGNVNLQGDPISFFNKLCRLIKSENSELFKEIFGFKLLTDNSSNSLENIFFPIKYDDLSALDQKSAPYYICVGLDLLKNNAIALMLIHGKNKYSLYSTIHHVGNSNSGHWYCNINNSDKWLIADNLCDNKIVRQGGWNTMPKLLVFKKITE